MNIRKASRGNARPSGENTVNWLKSSLSNANGSCVQVAALPGGLIGVRDSKDALGPVLRFRPDEWDAFIGGVHNGEFEGFSRRDA
jgi:Domain of unknown function (DUF397)